MLSQSKDSCGSLASRLISTASAAFFLVMIQPPQSAAQQPTATPVITDRAALATSSRFSMPPNEFKLGGTGDIFFTSGNASALFRWSRAAGTRSRLLQTNDPIEVLGWDLDPDEAEELAGTLLDTVGTLLQVNAAGHAAFVVSVAIKDERDPAGILVYDGTSYRLADLELETISQVLLNDNDRVAVLGTDSPFNLGPQMIVVETDSGEVLVARPGQAAPGTGGGTYNSFPQLIGFNNAGQVAFIANINGGDTSRAVFLAAPPYGPADVKLVAKSGSGGFNLQTGTPSYGTYYALNRDGKVAFWSTLGGNPGIWIGDASGVLTKLVALTDSTGITGWGNYCAPIWLRGFNDSGKVLYDCNTTEGPGHALFLKALADPVPQVVFYRTQPGGPAGQPFFNTEQATLNNNTPPKVAFLARSANSEWGRYLGEATPPPSGLPGTPPLAEAVAIQGRPTPVGGTFGLAGRNSAGAAVLNASNRVIFLADILDLNAVGLFSWTSGEGVRSVVSSRDLLPAGAKTVLRAGPPSISDTETLVRIRNAGGQATIFANKLTPGIGGLRKIVSEFDQVPGAGTVVNPSNFSMNAKGEVVFTAALLGSAFYPRSGIIGSLPQSGLEKAILAGDGAGVGRFTGFGAPQLNNQTQVAFYAITDACPNCAGIFIAAKNPPSLLPVARTGDPWPDGGGMSFNGFAGSVALNENGQVAFRGNRAGGSGLFVGTAGGAPQPIALTGQVLPGVGTVNSVPSSTFKLNNTGQVSFFAGLTGAHYGGVFLGTGGGVPQPLALTLDEAPGTGGQTFEAFRENSIELNSSGQVAFWAGLSDATPTPSSSWQGWFLASPAGSLSPRLLENQPLPEGGQAGSISPGSRIVALADSGELAIYICDVRAGIQPRVVIAGADGMLRKFATSGDKAEGTGSEFGKLLLPLTATPSGKFLFGAVLLNGPAKAGIFMNEP